MLGVSAAIPTVTSSGEIDSVLLTTFEEELLGVCAIDTSGLDFTSCPDFDAEPVLVVATEELISC